MDDVFIKVTREDFEKRYISRAAYDAEVAALRARVAELEEALDKSHAALNLSLNPRTPSDIMLAVKYLEGLPITPPEEQ